MNEFKEQTLAWHKVVFSFGGNYGLKVQILRTHEKVYLGKVKTFSPFLLLKLIFLRFSFHFLSEIPRKKV